MPEASTDTIKEVYKKLVKQKPGYMQKIFGKKLDLPQDKLVPLVGVGIAAALVNLKPPPKNVSPEFQKYQKEYQLEFNAQSGFPAVAKRKIAQSKALSSTIKGFGEIEFIKSTATGQRVLGHLPSLDKMLADAEKMLSDAEKLAADIPYVQNDKDRQAFDAFIKLAREKVGEQVQIMQQIATAFETMVDFEAIKAWAKKNPDQFTKNVETALYVSDQGVNAVGGAATVAGLVPEPITQAVAAGLNILGRALVLVKAAVNKEIRSQAAQRQIKEYQAKNPKGAAFDEHTKDPTLMADMLAKKMKANFDLALNAADLLIDTTGDFVPGVSLTWKGVRAVLQSTYNDYQDKRLELLQEKLGTLPPQDPDIAAKAKALVKSVGSDLWEQFKSNVFSILNPLDFIETAAAGQLGKAISKIVMATVKIDPAEPVDGGELAGMIDTVQSALINDLPQLKTAKKAGPQNAKPNESRRDKDANGNPVEQFYGDVEEDQGRKYRLAKVGGQRGALYLDNGEFVVDGGPQMSAGDQALYDLIPQADHRNRAVDEIDVGSGLVTPGNEPVEGMKLRGEGVRVRVGQMWGYIDMQTKIFFPTSIETGAQASWENRTVTASGYTEGGTEVAGTWYRPWAGAPSDYAFVGANGTEWAEAMQNTGRGKSTSFNIGNVLHMVPVGMDDLSKI